MQREMFQQARANTQPGNTPILQSMDEMLLSIFNEEGHATNLLDENVDFGLRSHDMLYALTECRKAIWSIYDHAARSFK